VQLDLHGVKGCTPASLKERAWGAKV
jgi:hypothetical protein